MRDAATKRNELEREHAEALSELRKKQEELRFMSRTRDADKRKALEAVQAIESKVRELQKKCELQNVRHEELSLEMATLRRAQAKQGWRSQRSQSADIPREGSYLSPTLDKVPSTGETWTPSLSSSALGSSTSSSLPSLDLGMLDSSNKLLLDIGSKMVSRSLGSNTSRSVSSLRSTTGSLSSSLDLSSSLMSTNTLGSSSLASKTTSSASSGISLNTSSLLDSTSHEIDRILARIAQDNRILAELEKSRATVGSPVSSANIERLKAHIEEDNKQYEDITQEFFPLKPSYSSPAIDQLLHEPQRVRQMYSQLSRHRSPIKPSVTVQHLNKLMEKLEQDNKILAELDRKRANIGLITRTFTPPPISSQLSVPAMLPSGTGMLIVTPSSSTCSTPVPHTPSLQPAIPTFVGGISGNTYNTQAASTTYVATQMVPVTAPPAYNVTEEILRAIDYIDLPGRGRCRVYIARYSYDPMKQSPNDNPEAELSLNAGDYLLITGDMDEDGFFSGELLDGRKGLVPSNFVEKLTGEDLFDFQTTVLYGNRDSDDSSASFTYAPDLDISGTDDFHVLPPEDYHRMNDYIDLEDIQEVDEENLSDLEREDGLVPPPPQRLILERQLNKSLLIGWLRPETQSSFIDTYHVYVDGVLKASVKANERTRALLEGVDSSQPHRISVRSVAPTGHHSADAACTIVVGKDVPLAPSCVKASNRTSTSAIISWLPSNSNFQHIVAVNSVEVRSMKPSTFRHNITGLAPNTSYRVSVRAKPGRLLYNDEKNPRKLQMLTTYVDFKTLPKGLPDPPLNIQVEAGPQDGTLLVTWLPVVNTSGTNAAPVTGYVVYAGGRKIAEVDSPSGDHALLDITSVPSLERKSVTVRTKSGDNLSSDSMPCLIPTDIIRGQLKSMTQTNKNEDRSLRERRGSSSDSESDTELTELLNHVTRRAQAFDPVDLSPFGSQKGLTEELLEDGSRSELPDIVEEVEDEASERLEEREKSLSINENGLGQDRGITHDRTDPRMIRQAPRTVADIRARERLQGRSSPPRTHRDHMYRMDDNLVPPDGKRRLNRMMGEHRNSSGQVIIEPDDNLSDKEIYPPSHMTIPSIEITKDTASEGCNSLENYSEEEYNALVRHDHRMGSHYSRTHKSKLHGHYYSDGSRRHMPSEQDHGYYNHHRSGSHRPDDYHSNGYREMGYHNHSSEYSRYPPDNRARWFVALFDYDPQTMSPNPDAAEEELPFQEGQLIKIYGDKDPDGFYRGEADGQIGYVPCNMVSEVQVDEPDISRQLMNENVPSRSHHTHHSMSMSGNRGSEQWGNSMPVRRMVALYDYDPQELSPNVDAEMELAFSTGDIIYVYGEMDEDGFYMGELNGVRGLVPSNFLTEAPPDYRDTRTREKLGPPGVGNSHERRYNMRGPPIAPSTPHQPRPKTNFLQTKDAMPPNVKPQDTRESTMRGATTFLTGLFTPQREATLTQEELFNAGKQRPTTLDLKGKLWAYQPFGGGEDKIATNQMGGPQGMQTDEKKGILSSVKDIFKPLWKN